MATKYGYIPTEVANISSALNRMFASMNEDKEGANFARSANRNFVVAVSSASALSELDPLLDSLCVAYPSRFFVVCVEPSAENVRAEISTRCNLLSKSESICSEVVKLTVGSKGYESVVETICAHLLTGMPTDLFFHDPELDPKLITQLGSLSDQVIFDSGKFEGRFELIKQILRLAPSVIDLQWVGIGPWRDQIKNVFDNPRLKPMIPGLRSATVRSTVRTPARLGVGALLIGGWFIDRLGLHLESVKGEGSEACPLEIRAAVPGKGKTFALSVVCTQATGESAVSAISLGFDQQLEGFTPQVELKRVGNTLETVVTIDKPYKRSRPLEESTILTRLERHCFIGESFTNYRAAAAMALRIKDQASS